MAEANMAYYTTRDPLGVTGDFITAPEISQMFGEMIGLWLAAMWDGAGRPADAIYVEPGPGRGTLAADALRAMARFGCTPQVHLVESSPVLIAAQRERVPAAQWHDTLATVPQDRPLLLVANEFLDALPVRQLVRAEHGWRERMVGLEGERFVAVAGDRPMDAAVPARWADAPPGTIIETCPGAAAVVAEIAGRLARQGGAALLIDYGYDQPATGSSLQAVQGHRKVDPLADPGAADLTALVDFATLAGVARAGGARHLGTMGQGAFLGAMGIAARASALARALPDRAELLAEAHQRLTAPDQMGTLFRVMGLAGADWPAGIGFDKP
ncbi:MAG: SAM-dependent methyltransferase [Proteobacteria bacterium]|nr:SAM-dependent methyltransferase [Pseudomonadota bacterium]